MDGVVGDAEGGSKNPTGNVPSEGSSARIQDTNSLETRELFSQPTWELS
jgi:hypothetical protein